MRHKEKNKNFYLSARRSRPILFFLLLFYFYFFFYIVSWADLRQIDTQFTTDWHPTYDRLTPIIRQIDTQQDVVMDANTEHNKYDKGQ